MKPSILLHSCCGPCSTAVIERLLPDFDVTVFYYNPNIEPKEEYEHRKNEQKRLCELLAVPFIEGDYENGAFLDAVKGFEDAPEGGARCRECFYIRLEKTAAFAKERHFDFFDSTLSVSPHKNYDVICSVGKELELRYGVNFLAGNYKKKDGFKRSTDLSREYGLYRQDYCGCHFSNWHLKKEEQ